MHKPRRDKMDKAALLVVERDIAYLFSNVEKAAPGSIICEVEINDDVPSDQLENEEIALWLQNEQGDRLVVARYDTFNFDTIGEDGFYPIPTPILVEDNDEYERLLAE